jgi:polyisoprenoid-binding protein YceI
MEHASTAAASSAAPTTSTTTWSIDPAHTEVGFTVKHLMISSVRGRFSDVDGTIVLDEQDPGRSRVDVEIGVASIDTGAAQRDADLRSANFFDAERWPTIAFHSTRVDPLAGGNLRVSGDLTIRDVTKAISFEATFDGRGPTPWGGEVIGYSADLTLNRKDFGLTYNVALETGGVLIGDAIKIHLGIEAGKQS